MLVCVNFQEIVYAHKRDGKIQTWLNDHVISDEVYTICEELVWEVLWDHARKISKDELNDLDDIYRKKEVKLISKLSEC